MASHYLSVAGGRRAYDPGPPHPRLTPEVGGREPRPVDPTSPDPARRGTALRGTALRGTARDSAARPDLISGYVRSRELTQLTADDSCKSRQGPWKPGRDVSGVWYVRGRSRTTRGHEGSVSVGQ